MCVCVCVCVCFDATLQNFVKICIKNTNTRLKFFKDNEPV